MKVVWKDLYIYLEQRSLSQQVFQYVDRFAEGEYVVKYVLYFLSFREEKRCLYLTSQIF